MRVIQDVHAVGAWAEVTLVPGMEREARRLLTLQPKDTELRIAQYRNHPTNPSRLFIPRSLVGKTGLPIEGKWDSINVQGKITYRDGQLDTINTYLQTLADCNPYGGIIQAVTGAGKTVMAIDIILKLGLKALIIVPRTSLVTQWYDRILQYTDLNPMQIGMIQGTTCKYNAPITIAMIHSLAQKLEQYPREMYHAFGTVVFDETHVVGAETFSQVAPAFRSKYRLGLSATPRRADGMDKVFFWHIGPVVAKFMKLQAKARVRIVPYAGRDTDHAGCVWGGGLNLGRYLNRIARSPQRLQFVKRAVLVLHKKGHDVLVLSERIQHLKQLRALLIAEGVGEDQIGMLIGNEKQPDRKIILGTYGSAGMGVDIPRLSALVLATPRADIEQAVGRVLRQGSPVVFDIVDIASSIMRGWAMKRKKFYRQITDDIQDRSFAA